MRVNPLTLHNQPARLAAQRSLSRLPLETAAPRFGAIYDGGDFVVAGSPAKIDAHLAVRAIFRKTRFIPLPYAQTKLGYAQRLFDEYIRPKAFERKIEEAITAHQEEGVTKLKVLWPRLSDKDKAETAFYIKQYADTQELQPMYERLFQEIPELEIVMANIVGQDAGDFPQIPRVTSASITINGQTLHYTPSDHGAPSITLTFDPEREPKSLPPGVSGVSETL